MLSYGRLGRLLSGEVRAQLLTCMAVENGQAGGGGSAHIRCRSAQIAIRWHN
jgi:hypothetical protein